MGDFERDTRITKVEPGRYGAELSQDWEIWGPNGGYLCAIALRAAGAEAQIARPVALYVHYLRVAKFAPVALSVELLGRTRRSESLRVTMRQEDKPILEAMVRTASVGEGLSHLDVQAPEVSGPEGLPDALSLLRPEHGKRHRFWGNFEVRVLHPERFELPRVARAPRWLEWYRVHCDSDFSDPFLDAGRSALLLDTMGWPAAVQAHAEPRFVAPSLDFAAWFHAPAPQARWLLTEAVSPVARDGAIAASGRLFSEEGTLLASSGTQLLCTPVPS